MPPPPIDTAQAARQLFCAQIGLALPGLGDDLRAHLEERLTTATTPKEFQFVRDTLHQLQRLDRAWMDSVRAALQQRLRSGPQPNRFQHTVPGRLELLATEVVEDELLASRLANSLTEGNAQGWSDLKRRLQFTLNTPDLSPHEITRPSTVAKVLVQEWMHAGLGRESWQQLANALHTSAAKRLGAAYGEANRFLIGKGVLPDIDFKHVLRKSPSGAPNPGAGGSTAGGSGATASVMGGAGSGGSGGSGSGSGSGGGLGHGGEGGSGGGSGAGFNWWNRVRGQTLDVVGRLSRLLGDGAGPLAGHAGGAMGRSSAGMSPALQAALVARQAHPEATVQGAPFGSANSTHTASGTRFESTAGLQHVQWASQQLHQQTREFKQATESPSEKATIEIVALMFQSILAEDRIQPSLRVWFARLQIPVLRVALAEPDFFNSMQHPTRQLIDRMGSCALGFDSQMTDGNDRALEMEIRRIVQMIEQYPETGRRVFQLALDDFQRFLTQHLSSQGQAGKVVSLAQQVEQKETLAVQYTIELRKQLNTMPVHESIRDFLFKVWAEVLAVATVKFGPQHDSTLALKQAASDLVWAASGKPTRAERTQVIAQLPGLLAQLRKGMGLMGMEEDAQEAKVKGISATLAEAFMSRTETLSTAQLATITNNLSNLENFLPADADSDLELDQDSIELITGIDASNIEVITHGGQAPADAVRAWAQELQLGTWFRMDHNNSPTQVQLVWRSDRGQLYLFTNAQQRCYLVQTARVAAYLQAGLLVPVEGESLTVRATRSALQKIDANPERLLT